MTKINQKGFTLVEIIVVLVIMVITVSIAAPSVSNYFTTINNTTEANALQKLNQSTQAYRVINEINTRDMFKGATTDSERQQILIDEGLIKEEYKPQSQNKSFVWSSNKQIWELKTNPK